MQERQIYKMKALDRWENEGGSVEPHQLGKDNAGPTDEQFARSTQDNSTFRSGHSK
jgi:hypothetical protein